MGATHPERLRDLAVWIHGDAEVDRRREGGVRGIAAVSSSRSKQFGVRGTGLVAEVRLVSQQLVAIGVPARVVGAAPVPA